MAPDARGWLAQEVSTAPPAEPWSATAARAAKWAAVGLGVVALHDVAWAWDARVTVAERVASGAARFVSRFGVGGDAQATLSATVTAFERARDAVPAVTETIVPVGGSADGDAFTAHVDSGAPARRVHLLQNGGRRVAAPTPVVFWFPGQPAGDPQDPTAVWLLRSLGDVCVASVQTSGHGDDDGGDGVSQVRNAAAAVLEVLAACGDHGLDVERVHLAGMGAGADLALECAALLAGGDAVGGVAVRSLLVILPTLRAADGSGGGVGSAAPQSAAVDAATSASPGGQRQLRRLPATVLCTCTADVAVGPGADRAEFVQIRQRSSEAYHLVLRGSRRGALVYDRSGVARLLATAFELVHRQ